MLKIGFSLQPKYDLPVSQVIELLKRAGFFAVSPVWSKDLNLCELDTCVKANNMIIQSLHAPHKDINLLWHPALPESAEIKEDVMSCIDACAQFDIPLMVIHGWSGLYYTFPSEPLNFSFFDNMVDHAEKKDILVAFENLEGEEYLEALMTRYKNRQHVGFCWDSGHDFCYPHNTDFLAAYGDRLIMTHINDNLGLRSPEGIPSGFDDLHFLPYDGKINWQTAIERLQNKPKQKILNFEFKVRSHSTDKEDLIYDKLTLEEFIKTAGVRAGKIANIYQEITANNN